MSNVIEIKVPDIGDFDEVDVIEVLVGPGDVVAEEDALLTLESDKASMDVPSSHAGTIKEMKLKVGDKAGEGSVVCLMEVEEGAATAEPESAPAPAKDASTQQASPAPAAVSAPSASSHSGSADVTCEMLVLGAGPGGYTAAFRAADLGMQTVLIERWSTLGGVCLNVGCIPSKALLHAAKVLDESEEVNEIGIDFKKPKVDIDKLRTWKEKIVSRLTGGLSGLAKQRKVQVVSGVGKFLDPNHVEVTAEDGKKTVVKFDKAVIAAGSEAVHLPFIPEDPRVIDSTGALELADVPKRMLVIGGGIIGLEMATVYSALGSKITVVEMLPNLVAGADKDIVKPYTNRIKKKYEAILMETRVTAVEATKSGMKVTFEGKQAPDKPQVYDRVLVAVGRTPNGKLIGAENAGVAVDKSGFVQVVDSQMRTTQPHIFAIGDIIGQPMLAHKAVHEGKTAAEAASGLPSHFDARVIPSVAYTDPEIAWVGVTEEEAKAQGLKYGKGVFPWAASGRALSMGREEGMTKLIFDEKNERVIGAGIVGINAGELIAEVAHAIEMGSNAADIGLTVHPHPTLSETVAMAAEMFEGTITDLYAPKKKK
ncbi:dihydrolipoyl dehydrogenase [Cocleimonas sp. KMM 6892]|uniref:dihydrolipoyl dehydrogenase n=1 Tax=unclassified Cocleimonas TaxID=2639732 RepID=UPI002DC02EF3|nr:MULTISPECIES: dihydrolipoyl dehydrogenase [unclassified Cocleimonas]MEB8433116.1 dihydrolipoyl dehydrogenase [Cocleimonas sp. KMM 6892]MEC4715903.1 dihydrolipoyl dehydrogenase [Cocleimonas sp. KMM 6895]MEC4745364.1 dihydrolipoyl dehydrogenase [Cocleimonas sp. KMM 6896]